ncbi:DUF881 domain-containing protein [Thalassobacillus sp. CUG 92003]|uniref:DUF881 domain-containing protein n=1 Tax=Thalassobacillus sp. CUG 92003 TaxID=2736641 RepID=UPI0015E77AD7|nr:DUF881 domain-containing protein [Thalassobacillus sp. CUG 92003]
MSASTKWFISLVFLIVGFMVAIQFQSMAGEPEVRETRDQWEIREALQEQQDRQQELLTQISEADSVIDNYNEKSNQENIGALKESIQKLEQDVGLTEATGSGVELSVEVIFTEGPEVEEYPSLSPELLTRLINDLNTFGATEIAVGNERITNLTAIRLVNGSTYVNNRPLPSLPLSIKVLSDNPNKLADYIQTSQSKELYAIENMDIKTNQRKELTLPEYEDPLRLGILQANN